MGCPALTNMPCMLLSSLMAPLPRHHDASIYPFHCQHLPFHCQHLPPSTASIHPLPLPPWRCRCRWSSEGIVPPPCHSVGSTPAAAAAAGPGPLLRQLWVEGGRGRARDGDEIPTPPPPLPFPPSAEAPFSRLYEQAAAALLVQADFPSALSLAPEIRESGFTHALHSSCCWHPCPLKRRGAQPAT